MRLRLASALLLLFATTNLYAADYRVEPLDEPAPADEISADIAATLATTGARVIRGTSTTFCDIWLCKQWETQADFKATSALLYPFTPGQLMEWYDTLERDRIIVTKTSKPVFIHFVTHSSRSTARM